jgi:hypothetical protein
MPALDPTLTSWCDQPKRKQTVQMPAADAL